MKKTIIFKKPAALLNRRTNYKKLEIWGIAYKLVQDLYPIIDRLPDYEEKNIADQMRRAVTSLPLNIAEGASSRFLKVFNNHLNYAYGSAKELGVLLLLCKNFNYINSDEFEDFYDRLDKLRAKTYKFIKNKESEIAYNQNNHY
ncbi:MAG: four helix bundle protein [Candidatus Woesearchaeota archaeon]